jgi:hypothetical protein
MARGEHSAGPAPPTTLRTATGPLTVAEIAAAALASKGIRNATDGQRRGVEAGIRSCLETNAGNTVQRVGEGVPKLVFFGSRSLSRPCVPGRIFAGE